MKIFKKIMDEIELDRVSCNVCAPFTHSDSKIENGQTYNLLRSWPAKFGDDSLRMTKEDMKMHMKNANIFIVDEATKEELQSFQKGILESERLPLPFDTIYVEMIGGAAIGNDPNTPPEHRFIFEAYMISTADDETYSYALFSPVKVGDPITVDPVIWFGTFNIKEFQERKPTEGDKVVVHPAVFVYMHTHILCQKMKNCSYGVSLESVPLIKMKSSGKTKRVRYEREVIYITTKEKTFKRAAQGTRDVEWKHKFKRRGHFRAISPDSLGKNRRGERVIYGETWVNETVVNDDLNLPMKKQIRVVR